MSFDGNAPCEMIHGLGKFLIYEKKGQPHQLPLKFKGGTPLGMSQGVEQNHSTTRSALSLS